MRFSKAQRRVLKAIQIGGRLNHDAYLRAYPHGKSTLESLRTSGFIFYAAGTKATGFRVYWYLTKSWTGHCVD